MCGCTSLELMKRMKKIVMSLLVLCALLVTWGCKAENASYFKESDKVSVVTSIYPMYDFAEQIAGERAEIVNLVPAGVEPHDFELSTGDMQMLEQADIFIYNGSGMEHFAQKTIEAVSNKELSVVEASQGVHTIAGHDGEEVDPHTWLSVENAIMECEAIKDAFVAVDPEYADFYEENYKTYVEKLEKLDEEYKNQLTDLERDTIVVAHEAFGYLCDAYGLKQEAVEGLTADSEPDSARMKEIIDFCKEEDIKVIFFEELVSPKVANTIAAETGAETMVLNPIEGLTKEQEESGLDYIGLMEANLDALVKALK